MATQFLIIFFHFLLSTLLISVSTEDTDENFVHPLDHKLLGNLNKEEKLSHFKFYWHDIASGQNPTSITIVQPPSNLNSTSAFGFVNIIDNPLTLGPQLSSKLVGRAQGFYASTSQSEVVLLMAMNFAITEGKYNGSSITILGRNPVTNKVREMPVIGGSGYFRFARGYAEIRTHWFSPKTMDAIVEYNVYVLHY